MYNKELYKKIVCANCSFEELEAFVVDIDKKEFDIDNAFEKYYDLEKILFAISRYENNEINDKYLAYWMTAYNWIIMGGFKIDEKDNLITFKEWLEWEICDWLDSLSFFDDSEEWYNLDDYKNSLKVLDMIYRNSNDWDKVFAHTDEFGDNEDDVVALISNAKTKEFVKIYGELDYRNLEVKFAQVEPNELEKEIDRLNGNGYRELRYGLFDYATKI